MELPSSPDAPVESEVATPKGYMFARPREHVSVKVPLYPVIRGGLDCVCVADDVIVRVIVAETLDAACEGVKVPVRVCDAVGDIVMVPVEEKVGVCDAVGDGVGVAATMDAPSTRKV